MEPRIDFQIDYAKGLGIDTNETIPEGIPAPPKRPERLVPGREFVQLCSTPMCNRSKPVPAVSVSPIYTSNHLMHQTKDDDNYVPLQEQDMPCFSRNSHRANGSPNLLNFSIDSFNRSSTERNKCEPIDNDSFLNHHNKNPDRLPHGFDGTPRVDVPSTSLRGKLCITSNRFSLTHSDYHQEKGRAGILFSEFLSAQKKNAAHFSPKSPILNEDAITPNISIDSLNRFNSSSRRDMGNETFMSRAISDELHFQQFGSWQNVKTPQRSSGSGAMKTATSTNTLTFSSLNRSSSTIALAPSVIVAVTEGIGLAKGEIGLAAVDLHAPTVLMSQFSDDEIYNTLLTVLQSLNPLQIIIPSTIYEKETVLAENLKTVFEANVVKSFDRKFFNECQGLDCFDRLCHEDYKKVYYEIQEKYYSLACLAAVVKYAEFVHTAIYLSATLSFTFTNNSQSAKIPIASINSLELLRNKDVPKSSDSLFGVLNYAKTPGGQRMLRTSIILPPKELTPILERQVVVEELVQKPELLNKLQSRLLNFSELNRLLAFCLQRGKSATMIQERHDKVIMNMMQLKSCLEAIPSLIDCVKFGQSPLFVSTLEVTSDSRFESLMNQISKILRQDVRVPSDGSNLSTNQKLFAVVAPDDHVLAALRRRYDELAGEVVDTVQRLENSHGLKLKLKYSLAEGYTLQVSSKPIPKILPFEFIKLKRTDTILKCTTASIKSISVTLRNLIDQIIAESANILNSFVSENISSFGVLHRLSVTVSFLDVLASLAQCSITKNWTKPTFSHFLKLNQSWHPLLAKIQKQKPVPNDAYLWKGQNFAIISGANMSGKTVYLRQLATIQILAQMGCFIPAEEGSVCRIANEIFYVGCDNGGGLGVDNCSLFEKELREIFYMLRTKSDKSLILVDEFGKSTSEEDAVSLCFTLVHMLCESNSFSLMSSHLLQLRRVESMFTNSTIWHMQVLLDEEKETYTYKLKPGFTQDVLYGIRIAERVGFPSIIIKTARAEAHQYLANKPGEENTDNAESGGNTSGLGSDSKLLDLFNLKIECLVDHWTGKAENLNLLLEVLNKQKNEGDLSWALEPFELYNNDGDSIAVMNDGDIAKPGSGFSDFSFNTAFDGLPSIKKGETSNVSRDLQNTFDHIEVSVNNSESCNQVSGAIADSFDRVSNEATSPTIVKGVGFGNNQLLFSLDSISP